MFLHTCLPAKKLKSHPCKNKRLFTFQPRTGRATCSRKVRSFPGFLGLKMVFLDWFHGNPKFPWTISNKDWIVRLVRHSRDVRPDGHLAQGKGSPAASPQHVGNPGPWHGDRSHESSWSLAAAIERGRSHGPWENRSYKCPLSTGWCRGVDPNNR